MRYLKVFSICYCLVFQGVVFGEDVAASRDDKNYGEILVNSDNPFEKDEMTLEDYDNAQNEMNETRKAAAGLDDGWINSAHDTLSKPIARLALRRLGTPGFMISKYMNIRKLLNQRRCTLSQELSFAGSMLQTVGDIAAHVVKYKSEKKLKKEFKEDKQRIEEYMKENSLVGKKNKLNEENVQGSAKDQLDMHLLSLNYLKRHEEENLKYKQFIKKFAHPARALHLSANIINAHEMFKEAGASATYFAEIEACRLRKLREQVVTDQKASQQVLNAKSKNELKPVEALSSEEAAKEELVASKISAPWYIRPFLWFGTQLESAKDWVQSKTEPAYSFVKDHKSRQRVNERASDYTKNDNNRQNSEISSSVTYEKGQQASAFAQGFDKAASMNYVEEMIVGVVERVRAKATKDMSGIAKAGVKLGTRVATRYAVRTAVKGNEKAIDEFMRSSAGRTSIYAYNIIMAGLDIKSREESIKYSKNKIKTLEALEKKFKDELTVVDEVLNDQEIISFADYFTKSLFNLLIDEAHARGTISTANYKFCLESPKCDKAFNLFTPDVKRSFVLLPKDVQKKQIDHIKKSYTINSFMKVANGKMSIESMDQKRVAAETQRLEKEYMFLINQLDKRNILKTEKIVKFAEYSIQKDMAWAFEVFPPGLNLTSRSLASVSHSARPLASENDRVEAEELQKSVQILEDAAYVKEVKKSSKGHVSVVTENTLLTDKDYQESMNKKFNYENSFHSSDVSIWKALHSRYQKSYKRLSFPVQ